MTESEKYHLMAGLTPIYDKDGKISYMGSSAAWQKYNDIVNDFKKQGVDYKEADENPYNPFN
jgi:hypothetical protein